MLWGDCHSDPQKVPMASSQHIPQDDQSSEHFHIDDKQFVNNLGYEDVDDPRSAGYDPFAAGRSAPPRYQEAQDTNEDYEFSFLRRPPAHVPTGVWFRKSCLVNPFFPTFFTFTVGSLLATLYYSNRGNKLYFQYAQRCRVAGQLATIAAIVGEVIKKEHFDKKKKMVER